MGKYVWRRGIPQAASRCTLTRAAQKPSRVERQYGGFTRSFTLPSSVDPGQVSADYDKGVLKINLAKKAEAKAKQIKVNVLGEKILEAKAHSKVA